MNVDAMIYGRFFQMKKNRVVGNDAESRLSKAKTGAIAGVTFSAVCGCLGAVSGAIL